MTLESIYWEDTEEGQELPTLTKEITATTVVAGAIASRDFVPVHHDQAYAKKQGVKDIFPNIQTIGGWVGKYLTNWTGPGGELKKINIRLGVPCFPGDTMIFTGKVIKKYIDEDQYLVDVELTVNVPLGNHCSGVGTVALPAKNSR